MITETASTHGACLGRFGMRFVAIVGVFVLSGLLGSCVASGIHVTEQEAESFRVGRSTYADVRTALGEPTSVSSSSDGSRVAVYSYSAIMPRSEHSTPNVEPFGGLDMQSSAVTFVFDANDILKETSSTQGTAGSGSNIAARTPQGSAIQSRPGR